MSRIAARVARRFLANNAVQAGTTLVLMSGPWGFMGYEVPDATPALAQLVAQANDAMFIQPGIRGSIEVVVDKGEFMDGEDGQWTPTTEAALTDALNRAMAGDDQALILH